MGKQEIGSMTAKGGFMNEADVCVKFENFRTDTEAQTWLEMMGYNFDHVKSVVAIQIPPRVKREKMFEFGATAENLEESQRYKKADIQLRIQSLTENLYSVENLSLKKANHSAGFNQVDKRPVLTYQKLWGFSDSVAESLRLFTGDILPSEKLNTEQLAGIKDKKKKRLFLTELPKEKLEEVSKFFTENKLQVVSDILKGRGCLSGDWFLVTRHNDDGSINWILKDTQTVIGFYAEPPVKLSPRGSLKIGRVTMQRKGGTPDPTSLQFKLNPLELFGDE